MANIRKTFNFRNGVQVDEDNFIVDSLGKVGIGTTVPTQMLDVRGDAKVVGILTSQSIEVRNVNVSGVTTFSGNTHVGAAITMYPSAGIISATQIHGDGRNLINIPTSQWTDINAGLGFTSIYNSGFVGVSTNDPRFTLQVGGNNDLTTFANGVGINSSGGIVATGVITATNFKGDVQGDSIVGNLVGNVNSSGLSTVGTVRFDAGHVYNALSVGSTNLNVTGVSTFNGTANFTGNIDVDGTTTLDNTSIVGNADISGRLDIDQLRLDGSTLSSTNTNGDINLDPDGTGRIKAESIILANVGIDVAGHTELDNVNVSGIITTVNAKVSTNLDLGGVSKLGVQTSTPQSQFHVFNAGISSVQVESGSGAAILTLGTNVNKRQTSGEIVYGKNTLTYSDTGSLDVINYNNSHVNSIIHLGSQAGINTGSWNWIYGKAQSTPKMTLTYEGNLGIGKTNAAVSLDVVGTSTVTTDSFVGANSWVAGNQVVTGNLTVNGSNNISIAGKNIDVTTGHSRVKNVDVTGNINVAGVSTFSGNVSVGGTLGVGIWHFVNDAGQVAIQTNTFSHSDFVGLDARHTHVVAKGLGVGNTAITAAVDFSNAGRNFDNVVIEATQANRMYMIPPKVTTAERGNLAGVVAGALIYNTNTNKLQVYNGSAWQDCN